MRPKSDEPGFWWFALRALCAAVVVGWFWPLMFIGFYEAAWTILSGAIR